jgi:hypothetical protein
MSAQNKTASLSVRNAVIFENTLLNNKEMLLLILEKVIFDLNSLSDY